MRRSIRVLLLGAVLAVVSATAALAGYAPSGSVTVTPSSGVAGVSVTVSGGGCVPSETLTIFFDGVQIGTTTADGSGNFSTDVTTPANASPGTHTIRVAGAVCSLETTMTITAAGGALALTGSLASTGASTFPTIWVALAAIAIGAVLVAGARRRTSVRARL